MAQWVSTEEEEERRISREGLAAAARRLHISTISSSKLDRDQARRGREGGDPPGLSPATDGFGCWREILNPAWTWTKSSGRRSFFDSTTLNSVSARSEQSFLFFLPFHVLTLHGDSDATHDQIIQQRSKLFHSHVHTFLSNPRPPS